MDETSRLMAGIVTIIILLALSVIIGRCSIPSWASTVTQEVPYAGFSIDVVGDGLDLSAAAGVVAEIETWLSQQTTTTRAVTSTLRNTVTSSPGSDRWDQLAQCETGGDWAANTGNGFGGGLQFAHQTSWSTWLSYGGGGYAAHPWEATRDQQIEVAETVLASSGWKAWPGCSKKLGWL